MNDEQCEAFKRRVDSGGNAFATYVQDDPPFEWPAARVCKAINGVVVQVHPLSDGKGWKDPSFPGSELAGLSYCSAKLIYVANQDWGTNALVHEMAHIYECSMGGYNTTGSHPRWNERKIYYAIGASQF